MLRFIAAVLLVPSGIIIGTGRHAGAPAPAKGVTVTQKQRGPCKAMLPSGWDIVSARDEGDALDVMNADHSSYAGWSIRAVNSAMRRYYGDLYADPVTSSRLLVAMVGKTMGDGGPFNYSGAPVQIGAGFIAQPLSSPAHRAMVVYKVYPAPPMTPSGSYIISLRLAIAPMSAGSRGLNTAVGVSTGMQCTTQFVAPKPGEIPLPRPGDAFDKRRGSETSDLSGYNVQLGTQYAHSPSTGQNFLLDRATEWNDHGPDGPGYYRTVGNSTEKLVLGIQ